MSERIENIRRKERKRRFLAFMEQWRHEVDSCGILNKLANDFDVKVHSFIREAAIIKPDLRKSERKRFDELIERVRFCGAHVTEMDQDRKNMIGRANLVQAFDEVIRFI